MNIHEVREEINTLVRRLDTREIFTILLILLVGFGSFGLGRLSKLQESKSPIQLENTFAENAAAVAVSPSPTSAAKESEKPVAPGGQLVASKGGAKYHFPWCSVAQRISEANKIWFNSVEEARKAGYTPASNCKGLK